ncbi:MAG: acyl-CoA desaturase [Bowdeniella nasicola]|nr:acyl-CoA desaturase [Bowdeniella nasicola]
MTTLTPEPKARPRPAPHLSDAQVAELAAELDALRSEVLAKRGGEDAAYIRRVIATQRWLEVGSRTVLLFSGFRPAWWLGTFGLAVAKILENMEIGHNVMHGQWDWMRDPDIHSSTWEWDHASPAAQWKYSHNHLHHTYTNVIDRDNDLGYGIMRVSEDQPWELFHLGQPLWNLVNAAIFEYSIAAYDLELGPYLKGESTKSTEEFKAEARAVLEKIKRQATKDYVIHPIMSGPNILHTLSANLVANLIRNVWSHSVIICGHFPEGVETFETDSIEGETRGEWYLRQMTGSANISGSPLLHLMTGNLSHQIEHHLFPDLPSSRYAEVAPRIREIMDRYQLRYVTGPMPRQVASVTKKIFALALPNRDPKRSRFGQIADAVRDTVASVRAARTRRRA